SLTGGGLVATLASTSAFSQLQNSAGALTLSGASLEVAASSTSTSGQTFTIVSSPSLSGTFTGLPTSGSTFNGANGRNYIVTYNSPTVPLKDNGAAPNATLDVFSGTLTYPFGGTLNDALSVTVANNSYTFKSSANVIDLPSGAMAAGWTGSGTAT